MATRNMSKLSKIKLSSIATQSTNCKMTSLRNDFSHNVLSRNNIGEDSDMGRKATLILKMDQASDMELFLESLVDLFGQLRSSQSSSNISVINNVTQNIQNQIKNNIAIFNQQYQDDNVTAILNQLSGEDSFSNPKILENIHLQLAETLKKNFKVEDDTSKTSGKLGNILVQNGLQSIVNSVPLFCPNALAIENNKQIHCKILSDNGKILSYIVEKKNYNNRNLSKNQYVKPAISRKNDSGNAGFYYNYSQLTDGIKGGNGVVLHELFNKSSLFNDNINENKYVNISNNHAASRNITQYSTYLYEPNKSNTKKTQDENREYDAEAPNILNTNIDKNNPVDQIMSENLVAGNLLDSVLINVHNNTDKQNLNTEHREKNSTNTELNSKNLAINTIETNHDNKKIITIFENKTDSIQKQITNIKIDLSLGSSKMTKVRNNLFMTYKNFDLLYGNVNINGKIHYNNTNLYYKNSNNVNRKKGNESLVKNYNNHASFNNITKSSLVLTYLDNIKNYEIHEDFIEKVAKCAYLLDESSGARGVISENRKMNNVLYYSIKHSKVDELIKRNEINLVEKNDNNFNIEKHNAYVPKHINKKFQSFKDNNLVQNNVQNNSTKQDNMYKNTNSFTAIIIPKLSNIVLETMAESYVSTIKNFISKNILMQLSSVSTKTYSKNILTKLSQKLILNETMQTSDVLTNASVEKNSNCIFNREMNTKSHYSIPSKLVALPVITTGDWTNILNLWNKNKNYLYKHAKVQLVNTVNKSYKLNKCIDGLQHYSNYSNLNALSLVCEMLKRENTGDAFVNWLETSGFINNIGINISQISLDSVGVTDDTGDGLKILNSLYKRYLTNMKGFKGISNANVSNQDINVLFENLLIEFSKKTYIDIGNNENESVYIYSLINKLHSLESSELIGRLVEMYKNKYLFNNNNSNVALFAEKLSNNLTLKNIIYDATKMRINDESNPNFVDIRNINDLYNSNISTSHHHIFGYSDENLLHQGFVNYLSNKYARVISSANSFAFNYDFSSLTNDADEYLNYLKVNNYEFFDELNRPVWLKNLNRKTNDDGKLLYNDYTYQFVRLNLLEWVRDFEESGSFLGKTIHKMKNDIEHDLIVLNKLPNDVVADYSAQKYSKNRQNVMSVLYYNGMDLHKMHNQVVNYTQKSNQFNNGLVLKGASLNSVFENYKDRDMTSKCYAYINKNYKYLCNNLKRMNIVGHALDFNNVLLKLYPDFAGYKMKKAGLENEIIYIYDKTKNNDYYLENAALSLGKESVLNFVSRVYINEKFHKSIYPYSNNSAYDTKILNKKRLHGNLTSVDFNAELMYYIKEKFNIDASILGDIFNSKKRDSNIFVREFNKVDFLGSIALKSTNHGVLTRLIGKLFTHVDASMLLFTSKVNLYNNTLVNSLAERWSFVNSRMKTLASQDKNSNLTLNYELFDEIVNLDKQESIKSFDTMSSKLLKQNNPVVKMNFLTILEHKYTNYLNSIARFANFNSNSSLVNAHNLLNELVDYKYSSKYYNNYVFDELDMFSNTNIDDGLGIIANLPVKAIFNFADTFTNVNRSGLFAKYFHWFKPNEKPARELSEAILGTTFNEYYNVFATEHNYNDIDNSMSSPDLMNYYTLDIIKKNNYVMGKLVNNYINKTRITMVKNGNNSSSRTVLLGNFGNKISENMLINHQLGKRNSKTEFGSINEKIDTKNSPNKNFVYNVDVKNDYIKEEMKSNFLHNEINVMKDETLNRSEFSLSNLHNYNIQNGTKTQLDSDIVVYVENEKQNALVNLQKLDSKVASVDETEISATIDELVRVKVAEKISEFETKFEAKILRNLEHKAKNKLSDIDVLNPPKSNDEVAKRISKNIDVDAIYEKVYSRIERALTNEKRRMGL